MASSIAAAGIKAALIDLSGTLHIGEQVIPGAVEACRRLQESGIAVRFLTNTSKTSSKKLLEQLRSIGFGPQEIPDIITTAGAARDFLIKHNLRPYCLVEEDLLQDDLGGVDIEEPHNCVLVGLAPNEFCYSRLNEAFRVLLKHKDATYPTLIALHRGKYYREADGELSLGPGGFVSCLEETSGASAVVLGKPSREFFQSAVPPGISPEHVVMVGDDVVQDCAGAKRAGIGWSILVKTGKYRKGDESSHADEVDQVVDSIVEATDYILGKSICKTSDST